MALRRLIALLTLLVTVHLTLVGSDNACADHGRHAAAAGMPMHSGHHGAPGANAPHAARGGTCETPGAPHCCDAVTSCATAFVVDERPVSPVIGIDVAGMRAMIVRGPLTRSLAPEPPPPKA